MPRSDHRSSRRNRLMRLGNLPPQMRQAAFSNVSSTSTKNAPIKAALPDSMRKITDRNAPTQAASRPATSSSLEGARSRCQTEPKTTDTKTVPYTRPEDTVTPTGVGKKSRTAGVTRRGSTTYAEAAANPDLVNEFCVAVMLDPFTELTQDQAEVIKQRIEEILTEEIIDPAKTRKVLRFHAKTNFANGVLIIWCKDAFTLAWLKRTIQTMKSPVAKSKLVVKPLSDVPKSVPCMLTIPGKIRDTATLLKVLSGQNSDLNINSWTITRERISPNSLETLLYLFVPEIDVNVLEAQSQRLYYLMGQIEIVFLNSDEFHQTNTTSTKQAQNTSVADQHMEPNREVDRDDTSKRAKPHTQSYLR